MKNSWFFKIRLVLENNFTRYWKIFIILIVSRYLIDCCGRRAACWQLSAIFAMTYCARDGMTFVKMYYEFLCSNNFFSRHHILISLTYFKYKWTVPNNVRVCTSSSTYWSCFLMASLTLFHLALDWTSALFALEWFFQNVQLYDEYHQEYLVEHIRLNLTSEWFNCWSERAMTVTIWCSLRSLWIIMPVKWILNKRVR